MTPAGYNGTYVVTSGGAGTFTYTDTNTLGAVTTTGVVASTAQTTAPIP